MGQANAGIKDDGQHPGSQGTGISSQQSYTGAGFLQNVDQEYSQNFHGSVDLKSGKQNSSSG
jgi:hypothetical protein